MNKILISLTNCFIFLIIFSITSHNLYGQEETTITEQITSLQKDIKTLEKAVYSQNFERSDLNETTNGINDNLNSDVLTKHLLKLSQLEDQFKALTNNFEKINFKLDKLSNRITKVQSDNQMRFQDLETSGILQSNNANATKKLPGSGEATDLGGVSESDIASLEQVQKTQSVGSVGTVITEDTEKTSKLLPDVLPEKQYEFALSFLKVGDYETAEFALREFIDTNSKHELAGNAQYWYGETFRVRQLYQDAASAYLDGYQKYPKSTKAPVNLLKLGVMLVQIGEKEQGCSMIIGVKTEYPKANQSVIQKADYENKKFNCEKKSQ